MNGASGRLSTTRFDKAVARVIAALKDEDFGVLREIDVGAAPKKKLGVDIRDYELGVEG